MQERRGYTAKTHAKLPFLRPYYLQAPAEKTVPLSPLPPKKPLNFIYQNSDFCHTHAKNALQLRTPCKLYGERNFHVTECIKLACATDETKLWLSPSAKQRRKPCCEPPGFTRIILRVMIGLLKKSLWICQSG